MKEIDERVSGKAVDIRLLAGAAASLIVLSVSAGPLSSPLSEASERTAQARCPPSSLHVSEVVATASEGWGPFTLFMGTLRFTNTGSTCALPAGRVSTRTELGEGKCHRPIGAASSGGFSPRIILRHGAVASVSARVDAVPPKGWKSGTPCGPAIFAGVLTRGPTPGWVRFVPLYPNPAFCSTYLLVTDTGALQLGAQPVCFGYARSPDRRSR